MEQGGCSVYRPLRRSVLRLIHPQPQMPGEAASTVAFPVCQKVSYSCRGHSFFFFIFYSPPITKPVDFTITMERIELGNMIQGDDHLTYPINGFQINLL